MAKINLKNRWVLVTGASSGLGRAIARCLASREKANLIITARRKERLEQLKTEIESTHPSRVEIVSVDLAREEDLNLLFKRCTEIAEVYAVINNAGITHYEKSDAANMEIYKKIINVNFKAPMILSLKFLSYFIDRGEGALLNVTSVGAFLPLPYQNVYSAAKHAAQAFTESLYREYEKYRKQGIFISSFAPGGIRTEMNIKSGVNKKFAQDSPLNMKPEAAALKAVRALKKGKYISVPGMMNKVAVCLAKYLPRKTVTWAAELAYRPPAT